MNAAVKSGHSRLQRGQTRDALLLAASELARESGLYGLTVDGVVERAGVSKGAFFHYFPTRQAMIAALLDHLAEAFERDLARLEAVGQPFAHALIEATLAEVQRDTGFMATLVTAVAIDRELGRVVEARTESWTQRMIREGLPQADARLVRSALDGLLLQCVLAGGSPLNRKRVADVKKGLLGLLQR